MDLSRARIFLFFLVYYWGFLFWICNATQSTAAPSLLAPTKKSRYWARDKKRRKVGCFPINFFGWAYTATLKKVHNNSDRVAAVIWKTRRQKFQEAKKKKKKIKQKIDGVVWASEFIGKSAGTWHVLHTCTPSTLGRLLPGIVAGNVICSIFFKSISPLLFLLYSARFWRWDWWSPYCRMTNKTEFL